MRGDGRVYLRGKIWWISYSHRGQEYWESSKSRQKTDAVRLLRTRVAALQQGLPAFGATQRHTVAAYLERAEAAYKRRGGRGLLQYQSHLKVVRQYFGGRRVVDVREGDLEQFVEQGQQKCKAAASLNKQLAILRSAMVIAHRDGIIPRIPRLPRLREAPPRQGFWEPQELERHVAALPEWLQDVARFGYLTGWRRGEVLGLEWRDVDMDARTLLLRPEHTKTGAGRLLALEGPLWELMQRRKAMQRPCPWVFHRDGKLITHHRFREAWRKAGEQVGTVGKLFHDLRRTAIRNMIRAGVPERIAMEISGHKSRSVFDRYNIVNDADMRQALQQTYAYLAERQTAVVVPIRGEL